MKENKKNTKSLIIYLIIFAFVVAVSINAIINQESKKQEIKMQISQYEDELEKLKSEKEELIEQKEKIKVWFNNIIEKIYNLLNIKGSLDNMYNVVDKIRNVTLITLIAIIVIMTSISIYTIIAMPKDIQIGEQSGIEYNNIIAKVSTKEFDNSMDTYTELPVIKGKIKVKNKFKNAISTKEKMNNFTGTKTKITSAIPEFNIEENQVNKEILNKISELNQKIKDGVEGKSSTKNLEILYIGYGNNIVVSLLLDVTEDEKNVKYMYNYDYEKRKMLTIEEYIKELGFDSSSVISKIKSEAMRQNKQVDLRKYITDEYGNILVFLDNRKSNNSRI